MSQLVAIKTIVPAIAANTKAIGLANIDEFKRPIATAMDCIALVAWNTLALTNKLINKSALSNNALNPLLAKTIAFAKVEPTVFAKSIMASLFVLKNISKSPNCFLSSPKNPVDIWLAKTNSMFCSPIIVPVNVSLIDLFAWPNLPLPEKSFSNSEIWNNRKKQYNLSED